MTPILNLPSEILLHIFSELEGPQLAQAERVCRRWQQICSDNTLWEKFKPSEKEKKFDKNKFKQAYSTYFPKQLQDALDAWKRSHVFIPPQHALGPRWNEYVQLEWAKKLDIQGWIKFLSNWENHPLPELWQIRALLKRVLPHLENRENIFLKFEVCRLLNRCALDHPDFYREFLAYWLQSSPISLWGALSHLNILPLQVSQQLIRSLTTLISTQGAAICDDYTLNHRCLRLEEEQDLGILHEMALELASCVPKEFCKIVHLLHFENVQFKEILFDRVAKHDLDQACDYLESFAPFSSEKSWNIASRLLKGDEDQQELLCLKIAFLNLSEEQRKAIALKIIENDSESLNETFFECIALFRLPPESLEEIVCTEIEYGPGGTQIVSENFAAIPSHPVVLKMAKKAVSRHDDDLDTAFLNLLHLVPLSPDELFELAAYTLQHDQWMICLKFFWKFKGLQQGQRFLLAQQLLNDPPEADIEMMEELCSHLPLFGLTREQRTQLLLIILECENLSKMLCHNSSLIRGFTPVNEETIQKATRILRGHDPHFQWPEFPGAVLSEKSDGRLRAVLDPVEIARHVQENTGLVDLDMDECNEDEIPNELSDYYCQLRSALFEYNYRVIHALSIYPLSSCYIRHCLLNCIQSEPYSMQQHAYSELLTGICSHMRILGLDEKDRYRIALALAVKAPHSLCQYIPCFDLNPDAQLYVINDLMKTKEGQKAYSNYWWLFSPEINLMKVEKVAKNFVSKMSCQWVIERLTFFSVNRKKLIPFLAANDSDTFCAMFPRLRPLDAHTIIKSLKAFIYDEGELRTALVSHRKFQLTEQEWLSVLIPKEGELNNEQLATYACELTLHLEVLTMLTHPHSWDQVCQWCATHSTENFFKVYPVIHTKISRNVQIDCLSYALLDPKLDLRLVEKNAYYWLPYSKEIIERIAQSPRFNPKFLEFLLCFPNLIQLFFHSLSENKKGKLATGLVNTLAYLPHKEAWLKRYAVQHAFLTTMLPPPGL